MMQIVEQTYAEKKAMYMKVSKEKLAEMLIESNRLLDYYTKKYSLPEYNNATPNTTYTDSKTILND